jgi:two-component system response regulator
MTSGTFILLGEDSADDAALTRIAFKEVGFKYEIEHVTDGAKALDFLFGVGEYAGRSSGDAPALILLDLKLPKVHGLDVLRRIRATPLLKHLVVVILTSSSEERDRLEAARAGATLFIQKPANYDDFVEVARQIDGLMTAAFSRQR